MEQPLSKQKRPLGVTVISAFEIFVAIGSVLSINSTFPLYGAEIEGISATILWLVLSALSLFIGVGLWRLMVCSWWLALIVNIFLLISSTVYYFLSASYDMRILIALYLPFTSMTVYLLCVRRFFRRG